MAADLGTGQRVAAFVRARALSGGLLAMKVIASILHICAGIWLWAAYGPGTPTHPRPFRPHWLLIMCEPGGSLCDAECL